MLSEIDCDSHRASTIHIYPDSPYPRSFVLTKPKEGMHPLADGSPNPLQFDRDVLIEHLGLESPRITIWHDIPNHAIAHAHLDILAMPPDPQNIDIQGVHRESAILKTGLMASTTSLHFSSSQGLFFSAYGGYPIFSISAHSGLYVADHHTTTFQRPDSAVHSTLEFIPRYDNKSIPAHLHLTIVERDDFGTPGSNVEGTFRFLATLEETDMDMASDIFLEMLQNGERSPEALTRMFDLRMENASFQPF